MDDWQKRLLIKDAVELVNTILADRSDDDVRAKTIVHALLDAGWAPTE